MPDTIVDFYLLSSDQEDSLVAFICKLCEKVLHQGLYVYINCPQPSLAIRLDQQLYAFRPDSFLPHKVTDPADEAPEQVKNYPILIGQTEQYPTAERVILNLATDIYEQVPRIGEFVLNAPEAKQISRQKYQAYKARGYTVRTHQIR